MDALQVTPNLVNTSPNNGLALPDVRNNEHGQTEQNVQTPDEYEVTPDLENTSPSAEEPLPFTIASNERVQSEQYPRSQDFDSIMVDEDDEIHQKVPLRCPRSTVAGPVALLIIFWVILGGVARKSRDPSKYATMAPSHFLKDAWDFDEDTFTDKQEEEEELEEDFDEDTFTEDQEEELEEEMERLKHKKPSWPTKKKPVKNPDQNDLPDQEEVEEKGDSSQIDSDQEKLSDQEVAEENDGSNQSNPQQDFLADQDAMDENGGSSQSNSQQDSLTDQDVMDQDGDSSQRNSQQDSLADQDAMDQDAGSSQSDSNFPNHEVAEEGHGSHHILKKNFLSKLLAMTHESDDVVTVGSSHFLALAWIIDEINQNSNEENLIQRYVLVLLDVALRADAIDQHNGHLMDLSNLDTWESLVDRLLAEFPAHEIPSTWNAKRDQPECQWKGIQCNDSGAVTHLQWMDEGLFGNIPLDLALLSDLQVLDLAENQIPGALPFTLYEMTNLEYIFLHQNRLTGGLSENVGQLKELQKLFLGDNSLTGSVPSGLGLINRLEHLILFNNSLTGTIPVELNRPSLFHLDLGRNRLTGTIPKNWADYMVSMDTIYLDHNKLSGSLPDDWTRLGFDKVELVMINNNHLTGVVPGNYADHLFLQVLEVQNNNFEALDPEICELVKFDESDEHGEMVALRTDCDICTCSHYCEYCTPNK